MKWHTPNHSVAEHPLERPAARIRLPWQLSGIVRLQDMWIAAVIGGAIAAVFLLFRGLQWHSDRTYRPSADAIRQIVPASLEGRLGLKAFDEFSCVRIAYDFRLEGIRERYNAIVNDPTCMLGEITDSNATPLNDRGRARLRELLNELGGLRRGRST